MNGWLSRSLAFAAGCLLLQGFAALPPLWLVTALPLLPLLARPFPRPLPAGLLWLPAGFLWALFQAHLLLDENLPPRAEGVDLWLEGRIASLPARTPRRVRFELAVDSARLAATGQPVAMVSRVRLSWYGRFPDLVPGETWRLRVRLKRPHGFRNPGGFDYERWLFRHGIRATGYVRADPGNRRLATARGDVVNRLRHGLRQRLEAWLPDTPAAGLLQALVVGDRSDIGEQEWAVLRATGTNHLMAISGLHIGLLAGLGFWLGRWLWRFSGRGLLWLPAPRFGVLTALFLATGYAALAGFSVPTQRALIMAAVGLLALWRYRRVASGQTLGLALLLVLAFDPLAVLDPGLWLSFAAVGLIFYGLQGRLRAAGRLGQALRVQWWISLGLLPLLLLLFGQASLISPLANLLAVPLVGLLVVPLALLGSLPGLIWPVGGEFLLAAGTWLMQGILSGLGILAGWPYAQWGGATVSGLATVLALAGMLLLLMPRGMPGRFAGALLLLPLLFPPSSGPPPGQADFTLLDVGQGLAAVVRTRGHVLIYDTGPRFGPDFEAGSAVVVPFLRAAGIGKIDRLLISHGDSDHRGGAAAILRALPVADFLASRRLTIGGRRSRPCRAGEGWEWDGVRFDLLHPQAGEGRGNDASCVLRVAAAGRVLLLTGDIERPAERRLVRRLGTALRADVLVAPHHGSRSSSSPAFLEAVRPRWVLFPVGYRNRYGFPDPRVRARYAQRRVRMLASAACGAGALRLGGEPLQMRCYRRAARHYWHDPGP